MTFYPMRAILVQLILAIPGCYIFDIGYLHSLGIGMTYGFMYALLTILLRGLGL